MPSDDLICDPEEPAIGTIRTFDSRLFANTTNPFIGAGGRVPAFTGLQTFEASGVNILSAPEKRPKERDLGTWQRLVCDGGSKPIQSAQFLRLGPSGLVYVLENSCRHSAFGCRSRHSEPKSDSGIRPLVFNLVFNLLPHLTGRSSRGLIETAFTMSTYRLPSACVKSPLRVARGARPPGGSMGTDRR